jgi:WD40 repeat protein
MTRINAALSVVSLTLSADGAIIVHDLKTGNVLHQYGGRNVSVEGIALSGNLLISVTADRVRMSFCRLGSLSFAQVVRTWNTRAEGDDPVSTHPSPLNNVGNCTGMHYCEALHLLTISSDQAVEVWDTSVWVRLSIFCTCSVSDWYAQRLQHVVRQQGVQCVANDGRFLWMGSMSVWLSL